MKKRLLLLIVLALVACHSKKAISPPLTQVSAFEVQTHTIPADFEFVGVTKSSHPVEIRSRVEGYLTAIDYVEGSLVREGDLLFEIDPREFEASVVMAEGELERQQAILWRAQKSLERIQPLYEKNAASLRDLDNATAQVLAAEASVMAAEGNLIKARLNLSYTTITSPITGMSGRALHQAGSLITPSINGLLTYVSIIDPIWVYFSVTNSELLQGRAEKAQEQLIVPQTEDYVVILRLSDGSTFPYRGAVNFSSPILDPKTGTMAVRAEFPNPQLALMPGQFVKAILKGAKRPDALVVPQSAIFQGKEGHNVFVINDDCTLSTRSVEVGAWYKDYWVIRSGLCPGERVVADGVNRVKEGQKVEITSVTQFEEEGEECSFIVSNV